MAREREILVRLQLRADQYNRGINQAERATDRLRSSMNQTQRQTSTFQGRLGALSASAAQLGARLGPVVIGLGALGAAVGVVGAKAVQTANNMQKLRLQVAAVVAANSEITDASGRVLQGVEKIRAAQTLTVSLFKEIQALAMKSSASVSELVQNLSVALPSAMSAGLNQSQAAKLVTGLTDAMKILQIESEQAKSEMRALFSGDITNDADLAKALKIRREDIEAAREQGRLYEFINSKLGEFQAAAQLTSDSLDANVDAANDFKDKLLELMGTDALEVLTQASLQLKHELMGDSEATSNLHNVLLSAGYEGREAMRLLANAVVKVGEGIVWLINLIGQADYTLRSWAINAAETIRSAAAEASDRVVGAVNSLPGGVGAKVLGRLGIDPKRDRSEEERYRYKNMRRELNDLYYGGKDIYAWTSDHSAQGIKSRPKKPVGSVGGGRPRRGRGGGRGGGGRTAEAAGREAQRAREQAEQATIQAMQDAFQHQERVTQAYGGGMAGSIRNMERYLEALKKLPRGHKSAAEEIVKIERDLQVERIRASVAAEEKKREELQRTVEAARQVAEDQRAYELALAENVASSRSLAADFKVDDELDGLDEQRQAIERLWERGKVNAQDYYAELQRLRVAELKAQAEADLERLDAQRDVLANRLAQQKNPLAGPVDWAGVAATEGQIADIDAQMKRVGDKFGADVARTTRENAQAFGDHLSDEVRAGLELAVEAVFTGDLSSIASGLQAAAKKGLVDALMSTEVGQKVGGLFSGAGGWKGALIAGFLDLIIGSFQDIGKAGRINQENARDLAIALGADDPLVQARAEVDNLRQTLKERRKSTRKFLGIIPIGSAEGFTTADEERQLAELEAKKIVEAQKDLAERRNQDYQASIDKALGKLTLLRRLGKATTQDLINELTRVLGVADITEEKALELQAQLLDLQEEQRQEGDQKWNEQLEDQLTFNEVTLQQARERVTAEMALVDQSTEYGYQRYRELRHRLKDIDDQIAEDKEEANREAREAQEEAARAAEEAAERFKDAWEEATSASAEFFKRLADAARNELEFLRNAYDERFAEEERDLRLDVAYSRRSRQEAEYLLMEERIDALRRQLNDLVRGNTTDQGYLTAGNRFQSGAWIEGDRFFANTVGDIPTFLGQLAAEMNRRGATWLSTQQGGQGFQYQATQLSTLTNNYRAALERLGTREEGIAVLEREIAQLNQARDVIKAEVEGGAPGAIRDLDLEYQLLRAQARGDTAAIAAAKKAQIDQQIEERRLALFHQGLMSGEFDIEQQNILTSRLDAIKALLKDQVDAEVANRPTDSNPLPVRVVELPPAFPIPSSFYFRGGGSPALSLEAGAIVIQGSGLNEAQLTGALRDALTSSADLLARTVNRQNDIGNAIVRLN